MNIRNLYGCYSPYLFLKSFALYPVLISYYLNLHNLKRVKKAKIKYIILIPLAGYNFDMRSKKSKNVPNNKIEQET